MTKTILHCTMLAALLMASTGSARSAEDTRWQAAPGDAYQAQLTIKEAILRAFARNPNISMAAAQISVGKANLSEAESAWFPQVSLQGNTGRSHRTDSSGSLNSNASAGINLRQLLWDFGKTSGSIDEQHNLSDAYRYQLYDSLNQVGMQTLQTYLQVKRFQALEESAKKNTNSLNKVLEMAKLRAKAGLNSQSDVLQAQTRIAGMNATLVQYTAQRISAQAALSVLTGVTADTLPDLPVDLLKQKITLKTLPYEQSYAVRSARAKQLAADDRIRQAQAQHWPTLSVQAGRTRYQSSSNSSNYWDDQVQLVVDAPLYQGGAVSARVDAAEGDRANARAQVEASKLDINQKAATAWADLAGSQQRQQAGEMQYASAERARLVYQDEYQLSKRSLNDLLSIEQDVFQADTSAITARYDGWDAAVRYAAAADNLLDMLGIERSRTVGDTLPSL